MKEISPQVITGATKVTVVGTGQVGMASAFSLMTLGVCSDLALVDMRRESAIGEKMDMSHGVAFLGRRCNIDGDSDYAVSKNSKVVIVTAGVRQKEGESRLDLVQRNVGVFKSIIPQIVKYSPDCVLIIVSNPCDILAWVTWKITGWPKHRIISAGTILDTSRFRHLIAERFNVAPHSVHGYIIGEHGDTSVACWSSVSIAGTRLRELCPTAGESPDKDPENWQQVHTDVIQAAYEIIKNKGFTNWGIGITSARLAEAVLKNQRTIFTVGTLPDGWNGITEDVFLSIPAVIGERGITQIVSQKLSESELAKIQESGRTLRKVCEGIDLN